MNLQMTILGAFALFRLPALIPDNAVQAAACKASHKPMNLQAIRRECALSADLNIQPTSQK